MRLLKFLLVAGALFIPAGAFADIPSYHVVQEKSFLKFVAIQNNASVEGKFKDFTADIRFDPDQLDQSSIKVEVAIASVTLADGDIAKNIVAPEWLSAAAFPKATFACKKLTRMPASDNYYADGQLTLRGKTIPVVLNFQMEHFDGKNAVATGSVTLHRRDFDVGQGEWSRDDVIKDEVRVEFRIAAEKQ